MELAKGQGGSRGESSTAHAHRHRGAEGDDNDETIISELRKQMSEFSSATQGIKTLAEAVTVMRQDIKELQKRKSEDDSNISSSKKKKSDKQIIDTCAAARSAESESESTARSAESESESDIEGFLIQEESATEEKDTGSFLEDLDQFFSEQKETGEELNDKLAAITNEALRGSDKRDVEKIKEFREKYKRPVNVENLQVPTVEEVVWRQLQLNTKTVDFLLQKVTGNYALALTPLLRALDLLKSKGSQEDITSCLMDTFKILCLTFKATNTSRIERIRKDIQPQFKAICDNESSATKLFGDNLQETVKKLETNKVKLVNLTTGAHKPFLSKRGGLQAGVSSVQPPKSKECPPSLFISTQKTRNVSKEENRAAKEPQEINNSPATYIAKDRGRQHRGGASCTNMANTSMVAEPSSSPCRDSLQSSKPAKDPLSAPQARTETSAKTDETWAFSSIRSAHKTKGVPRNARDIILKSWRSSTKQQYNTYIKKWITFCGIKIDPINPSINQVLQFMSNLFRDGLQYRSLCVARSALSSFLRICGDIDITSSEELTRFMKGTFNERPALPKYKSTWDIQIVLDYLQSLKNMTLLQLSCKTCMLFLILSAQRCQTLHLIEVKDIIFSPEAVFIQPNHILKQSRPGYHQETIHLKAFNENPNICIVQTLKEYIKRTENLRTGQRLLISTIKPFKAVSRSTVTRWVKNVMREAGVSEHFGAHSTRSASTSRARLHGIPLETIVRTAGWTNAKTFARFYNKPISGSKTIHEAIYKPSMGK
ncbi:uncharacterized protein LOC132714668 isoform X2 [Ruditapes philippinarum]|nr:uncharacterized protein LOC132714668 isoform X2 [Ruditapes philippinarum]